MIRNSIMNYIKQFKYINLFLYLDKSITIELFNLITSFLNYKPIVLHPSKNFINISYKHRLHTLEVFLLFLILQPTNLPLRYIPRHF